VSQVHVIYGFLFFTGVLEAYDVQFGRFLQYFISGGFYLVWAVCTLVGLAPIIRYDVTKTLNTKDILDSKWYLIVHCYYFKYHHSIILSDFG